MFPERFKRSHEEFQDKVARIYPELYGEDPNDYNKRRLSRTVTFQVTDSCNLACTYCYQHNKSTRRMSFETAKQFIDLLLSGEKGFSNYINPDVSPMVILEFIGGEPLLEIDLINDIVNYFISACLKLDHPWATGHVLSMCSNGILYKTPKVQDFLERNKKRLSFSITMDGNKELHDACRVFPDGRPSYDIVYDAVTDWRSKGYYMGSKLTIAPANVKYVFKAIKHMMDMGYDTILANCVYEEGWEVEHATVLYHQLKELADYLIETDNADETCITLFDEKLFAPMSPTDNQNWCGGAGLMIACDPDGNIYPCLRYMESSVGKNVPPFRIGNIHDGIGQCQEHSDRLKCINCITRRSQSTDECFNCPIANGCSWCSAYNYEVTGTPNKRLTYICIMHKARALANAYLWSRWYAKHFPEYKFPLYIPKEWALEVISEEEFNNLINFDNLEYLGK